MLLYPEEVDQRLHWPLGRAAKLARKRLLPYVLLPDGSVRFDPDAIDRLLVSVPPVVEAMTKGPCRQGGPERKALSASTRMSDKGSVQAGKEPAP
jgi:hypothetical protein